MSRQKNAVEKHHIKTDNKSFENGKGKAIQLQAWTGPLGLQEVEAPRISRQLAHEGGKVVSATDVPPLPTRSL